VISLIGLLLLHCCLILLLVGFITVNLLMPNYLQATIVFMFMLTIVYYIIFYVYYSVNM